MRALSIIEAAYRATLEEQDDTIVWLVRSIRAAGGEVDLLLKGSTANYAVRGQNASGLVFGTERQTRPPELAQDVSQVIAMGAKVYIVKEDVKERGLEAVRLINGLRWIGRAELARVISMYDSVWYW